MKKGIPAINLPAMEREILKFWEENEIFTKSNAQRKRDNSFSFYDGPPFANGLPHYGHMLATTLKDSVTRYWNMRGKYVERRFGWDCHGLPVEYEIEKKFGLSGRKDILKMGVKEFNDACRKSVTHYTSEWQKTVSRIGRFVDWDNQYRTMDLNYMESVWWVFSELSKKNLIYKDRKIVAYSPRITAVVSNFEANQNYKDVQDPSLTVKFEIKGKPKHFLLGWTTTPWTLVSNLALAVSPDLVYLQVYIPETKEMLYFAEERLDFVFPKSKKTEAQNYEIKQKMTGEQLSQLGEYLPLFPYFKDTKNAFKILIADYVSSDSGTGIVHNAPAFGEDDFQICRKNNIELVDPLDEEAKFTSVTPEFEGLYVKDADKVVIKVLRDRELVFRSETIVHSYPHCDRTDDPLIYRAIPTWYVAVEKLKNGLIRNNQDINWVPDHLKNGRMGQWLENARDWAISRNRFWGTPIPVWECDQEESHRKVISSVEELAKVAGIERPIDLHKDSIDGISFPCDKCSGTLRRIPEVFDCWFESGSMPYAQKHYPFEQASDFKETFPADFIAEGQDQTRGWFYTLAVLSEALFETKAFKNVIVNGLILAADGKKMSKRLGNYTPPETLLEEFGADSIRLYMLNSPVIRGENLKFTNEGVRDTTRSVLLPFWNAYSFLSTYAEADNWTPSQDLFHSQPPKSNNELDIWIISRLQSLLKNVEAAMNDYKLFAVIPALLEYIEDLTNWYIRLSRRRFWTDGQNLSEDSHSAYRTLTYVLTEFSKVFAPYAPFIADHVYQNLTDGVLHSLESVHLADQPTPKLDAIDLNLEKKVEVVRRVTELGRSLRAKHQLKIRQVLASMEVVTQNTLIQNYIKDSEDLIKEELNIKEIKFSTQEEDFVTYLIKPNLKNLGRKLGPKIKDLQIALSQFNKNSKMAGDFVRSLGNAKEVTLIGEVFSPDDFLVERIPVGKGAMVSEAELTIILDTEITEPLRLEGLSREVINRIQKHRKESDFNVSDRIAIRIWGDHDILAALKIHQERICDETLAKSIEVFPYEDGPSKDSFDLELEEHLGGASIQKV